MWINKLKQLSTNGIKKDLIFKNIFNLKKFKNDKQRVDMFVYGNDFGKNEKSLVLKKEAVPCIDTWLEINSASYGSVYTDNITPYYINKDNNKYRNSELIPDSNGFFSSLFLKKKPINSILVNTSNIKNADTHNKNESILKKVQEIENENISKEKNPTIHFFTENDYFNNNLNQVKSNDNGNSGVDNIFFVNQFKTNVQCSSCLSGKLEDVDNKFIKDGNKPVQFRDSRYDEIKINLNKVAQCGECKIVIDKECNEIINLSRRAESLLVKGRDPIYLKRGLFFENIIFKTVGWVCALFFSLLINSLILLVHIFARIISVIVSINKKLN